MKTIKRNLTAAKITLALIILICGVFFAGVISQNISYRRAIDDIAAGRYATALDEWIAARKDKLLYDTLSHNHQDDM